MGTKTLKKKKRIAENYPAPLPDEPPTEEGTRTEQEVALEQETLQSLQPSNEYPYGDEGVQKVGPTGGSSVASLGAFRLPKTFDSKRYASSYVELNDVASKQSTESLIGTGYVAPGWAVWKDPDKGEPHSVVASKKKFLLLFRPRKVQEQVNRVFGKVSRERLMAERSGKTIGGEAVNDSGILDPDRVTKAERGIAQRMGVSFVGEDEDNSHKAMFGEELPADETIRPPAQQLRR